MTNTVVNWYVAVATFLNYCLSEGSFSKLLVQDFKRIRTSLEMDCTLRFIGKHNMVEWTEVISLNEPFVLQSSNVSFTEMYTPRGKFKSVCWTNIISIQDSSALTGTSELIGSVNSVYDELFFVAQDSDLFEKYVQQNLVMDRFARKYGVILENVNSTEPRFTYMLEPDVYIGSFVKSTTLKIEKRLNNLNGRTIMIPFHHIPPYFVRESEAVTGIQNHLIKEMAKRTNFTPKYYDNFKVPGFGVLRNGSWTGIMGELANARGELAPALALSLERFPAIRVTDQTLYTSLSFFVKIIKPKNKGHAFRMLGIITFCIFVILFLLKIFLEKSAKFHRRKFARPVLFIWAVIFSTIGVTCRCRLVTFLTVSEKMRIPNTLRELWEENYSLILWQVGEGGMEMEIFRTLQNPVVKALRKGLKTEHNITKCINAAETQEKVACVGWKSSVETMIAKLSPTHPSLNHLKCGREAVTMVNIVVGLRKGSIFLETVNRYILAVRSAHLEVKWERDFYAMLRHKAGHNLNGNFAVSRNSDNGYERDNLDSNLKQSNSKLGLILNMVYLVILCGCCLSISCFFLEITGNYISRDIMEDSPIGYFFCNLLQH